MKNSNLDTARSGGRLTKRRTAVSDSLGEIRSAVPNIDRIKVANVKGDIVAVVGNMGPTVKKLRARAKKVYVLERNSDLRDDDTLPDTAVEEVIPESNVVLITGTSIVNGTLDRLLELSRNAKEVALVGATAGLLPTILFKHGATAVGTIKVTNVDRVMRIIAEGGGTPSFADAVEFVVYKPVPRAGEV